MEACFTKSGSPPKVPLDNGAYRFNAHSGSSLFTILSGDACRRAINGGVVVISRNHRSALPDASRVREAVWRGGTLNRARHPVRGFCRC